jgi:hypothetical protein
MRPKRFILTAFAVLLTGQIQIKAQKIYLSPSGNDKNPGSIDMPFASLNRARDRARELLKTNNRDQPVEVIALEGEYFMMQPLDLTEYDGGTEDNPLIFKAEPGTKAIFRGGVEVTGFEKVNDKIWRAFVPQVAWYDSYFEQLYVNGRRAMRARSPNDGFHTVKNVSESVIEKGEGRFPKLAVQQIEIDPSDTLELQKFSKQDFRDALIVFYHNWDNTRKRITGYSSSNSSVFIAGEGMKPWNPINSKSRYFIENFRAALDVPGEWYLDRSGYLYYIPLEGETIENSRFFAPVIREFVSIKGNPETGQRARNIRFDNLIFEVAGYKTPPEGNEPAQAAAPLDAVITADFAGNIEFRNCEISHTGTYAFWFRRACSNCLVTRCYLHDLGAGGVKIGETIIRQGNEELTANIVIDNNIIRDAGHVFPCAVGIIIFNACDNALTHNEITDLRYSGISVGWVWGYAFSPSKRNRIAYNHIHHLGWGELSDMGGVYTLGASEGTVVNNNLIHHIYSFDYGGWGLYTDEGSFDIIMENNLVYACKNSGFHQHYGKENIIRNNIFALNIKSQLQATRIEEHRSLSFTNNIIYFNSGTLLSSNWDKFNLFTDNNCYWDTRTKDILFGKKYFSEWRKEGKDIHSVIRDPLFISPESFNFHFRNLSVAGKIGFKPFDYTEAGVYGSDEWKDLARFDEVKSAYFDEIVRSLEGENR